MSTNKLYVFVIFILIIFVYGCKKDNVLCNRFSENGEGFSEIKIQYNSDFYDYIVTNMPNPEFIVLKETDNIMFSEIDKIIATGGKYYIMDAFGANTVVSFDEKGKACSSYGRVGQGPGEYFRPRDIDVDDNYLYILDSNQRKIIKYSLEGNFVDEMNIPFHTEGFKKLRNGEFIFNVAPDGGNASPRLCIANSDLSNFEYFLPAPDGYVGGVATSDNFRSSPSGIIFYQAPSDTLYYINDDGMITGGILLDYGIRKMPDEAKIDYMAAREKGLLDKSLILYNNPIRLRDGLMVATTVIEREPYVLIFDVETGESGIHKSDAEYSVNEIIKTSTLNDDGKLVCYTNLELIKKAKDFESIPDSIKSEFDDNFYILTLYSLNKKNG